MSSIPTNGSLALDDDGIAHVRLTRPDKLNALDPAMFEALLEAGQALFDWPGLRCVVLSGEGRAFCAGLDLSGLEDRTGFDERPLADRTHGNANAYQQAALQWRKLPVPVIAAIHGACFGGGLQIAAGADIRVAAPDARLAAMEVRWGMVPDMGLFALLRGCVRDDILRELVYTHREVDGHEASEIGLVTHVDTDPIARANAIAHAVAPRARARFGPPSRCSTATSISPPTRSCWQRAASSSACWARATRSRRCAASLPAARASSPIAELQREQLRRRERTVRGAVPRVQPDGPMAEW